MKGDGPVRVGASTTISTRNRVDEVVVAVPGGLSDADYAAVRRLGVEYRKRNPRSVI